MIVLLQSYQAWFSRPTFLHFSYPPSNFAVIQISTFVWNNDYLVMASMVLDYVFYLGFFEFGREFLLINSLCAQNQLFQMKVFLNPDSSLAFCPSELPAVFLGKEKQRIIV